MLLASTALAAEPSLLEERLQVFRDGTLRGFAISALPLGRPDPYTEADFRDLVATGANVVRVPVHLRRCTGCREWTAPDADLAYAERVLAHGERLGFKVVVVFQPEPWGERSDYWDDDALQASLAEQWGLAAQRLKDFAALQAYDLINEPVVPGEGQSRAAQQRWHALATRIGQAIRAQDPHTPLMIEPVPWGLAKGLRATPLLALPGLVYSFHLYDPHGFTHQGLPKYPGSQAYPGQGWDRARLSQALEAARAFARQHGVPFFVGEFSCVRWAPQGSCLRYLQDATELFAAERWGFAYHCWRCYQGWDAEVPESLPRDLTSGPQHRRSDTPRLQWLKQAFKQGRPGS